MKTTRRWSLIGSRQPVNIIAGLALFLALGGGTAVAVTQLDRNSVDSRELKRNSVGSPELKRDSVGTSELAPGAVLESREYGGDGISDEILPISQKPGETRTLDSIEYDPVVGRSCTLLAHGAIAISNPASPGGGDATVVASVIDSGHDPYPVRSSETIAEGETATVPIDTQKSKVEPVTRSVLLETELSGDAVQIQNLSFGLTSYCPVPG